MECQSGGCAASRRRCRGGPGPRRLAALCMSLAVGVALPGYAVADDQPVPFQNTPEAQEADDLFRQLLKDPKNVDLTFRYAQAAVKSGNIEGAISSLERLLLLDRNFRSQDPASRVLCGHQIVQHGQDLSGAGARRAGSQR